MRGNVAPVLRHRSRVEADVGHGVLGAAVRAAGDFDPQVAVGFTISRKPAVEESLGDSAAQPFRRSDAQAVSAPGQAVTSATVSAPASPSEIRRNAL